MSTLPDRRRDPERKTDPLFFPTLLTESQVASRLAVSPRTLQMWRLKGGGPPFVKMGSAVRYRPDDIEHWVSDNLRAHTADPGPGTPRRGR